MHASFTACSKACFYDRRFRGVFWRPSVLYRAGVADGCPVRGRFIVKEGNYTEIVMSSEFETLSRTLMVEIVRRRQAPVVRQLADPQFDPAGKCTANGIQLPVYSI